MSPSATTDALAGPMTNPALFDSVPLPADAPDGAFEAWTATEYARGPWGPTPLPRRAGLGAARPGVRTGAGR